MTPKVFVGLALVTVITTVAAIVVALEQPTPTAVHYGDQPAFPELRANPDAVAKVALTTPEGSFTLVRASADKWVAPERSDYPVASHQVRDLIVTLADMRLIEPKTTRPDLYARLEVEDVGSKDAKSRLIRLESADGKPLAEAIIGKQRQRLTGSQSSGTYIRRPGEEQSWLASGGLRLEPTVVDWLDDQIVDLQGDSIRRIEVQPESGPGYALVRDGAGGPLRLDGLQEGETAKKDADFGKLANALSSVRLEDVRPRDQLQWPAERASATATTFDGLQLTVQLAKVGDEHWAMFDASQMEPAAATTAAGSNPPTTEQAATTAAEPTPPAATPEPENPTAQNGTAAEAKPAQGETAAGSGEADQPTLTAEALNRRLGHWAYRIPEHVYNRLTTARSDWLAKKDETS